MNADDIGDFYDGPYLQCHTNNIECCSQFEVPDRGVLGEWYLPNGAAVGKLNSNGGQAAIDVGVYFFARRRGPSTVSLFRGGAPSDRGRFHCEVPNAAGINQTVYANICKFLRTTAL